MVPYMKGNGKIARGMARVGMRLQVPYIKANGKMARGMAKVGTSLQMIS
jgi:hypothetical protein